MKFISRESHPWPWFWILFVVKNITNVFECSLNFCLPAYTVSTCRFSVDSFQAHIHSYSDSRQMAAWVWQVLQRVAAGGFFIWQDVFQVDHFVRCLKNLRLVHSVQCLTQIFHTQKWEHSLMLLTFFHCFFAFKI